MHTCDSYFEQPSNIASMAVPGEEGGGPPVVVHLEEGLRQGARLVQRSTQRRVRREASASKMCLVLIQRGIVWQIWNMNMPGFVTKHKICYYLNKCNLCILFYQKLHVLTEKA